VLLQSYGDLIIFLTGTEDIDEMICMFTLNVINLMMYCCCSGRRDRFDIPDFG
jgi:hypothetical protein